MSKLTENVVLSAHIAENPYKVDEFLNDLYAGVFEPTMKGKALTEGDRLLQRTLVNTITAPLEDKKSGGLFFLTNAYTPSIDEVLAYGLNTSNFIRQYERIFRQVENEYGNGSIAQMFELKQFGSGYDFLSKIDIKNINESEMYLIDLAYKAQQLIALKMASATGTDRVHYQSLLSKIKKVMKAQ